MKRGSTIFLRGVVLLIGLIVLWLCIFALPPSIVQAGTEKYRPLFLGLYVTAVPFFVALYHTLKLLGLIDQNKAFSQHSVDTLGSIKYCAVIIGALFAVGMPYMYFVAHTDDAPGTLAFGLVIALASAAVAVFAAVLQRILQDAIDIKTENDLTV